MNIDQLQDFKKKSNKNIAIALENQCKNNE